MAPALLCLRARAVISSKRGEREIPFKAFFKGVKKTAVAPDEVVERVVVPAASAGARGGYYKLKRINGHDLGIVGVALCIERDGEMRLTIGSCAPDSDAGRGARRLAAPPTRWSRRSWRRSARSATCGRPRNIACTWSRYFVRRLLDEVRS